MIEKTNNKDVKLEENTKESLKEMYKELFVDEVIKTINIYYDKHQEVIKETSDFLKNTIQPLILNSKKFMETNFDEGNKILEENAAFLEKQQSAIHKVNNDIEMFNIKLFHHLNDTKEAIEMRDAEIRNTEEKLIDLLANKQQINDLISIQNIMSDDVLKEFINLKDQLKLIEKQIIELNDYNSNFKEAISKVDESIIENNKFLISIENNIIGKYQLIQKELKQNRMWQIFSNVSILIGIIIILVLMIIK